MDEHIEIAKAVEIIQQIQYINLSTTALGSHQTHPSPVYAGYDEECNFYWVSDQEAKHSKNIHSNPLVSYSIYNSTIDEGRGKGVYFYAIAFPLEAEDEIAESIPYLYDRIGTARKTISEFTGTSPRRIYKATPVVSWTNGFEYKNGVRCDVEISLPLPKLTQALMCSCYYRKEKIYKNA